MADIAGLNEEQKDAVQRALAARERAVKKEAKDKYEKDYTTALDEAKSKMKNALVGIRKPDPYDPSVSTITKYFKLWETFSLSLELDDQKAVHTFLTYLDPKSHHKVTAQDAHRLKDFDDFRQEVITILSEPAMEIQARYQLADAKQNPGETVSDFVQRLVELAEMGFREDEEELKKILLKDALAKGLSSRPIGLKIIAHEEWTFKEAYQHAAKQDALSRAFGDVSKEIEFSVLKTEEGSNVICYNCGDRGHFKRNCTRESRSKNAPKVTCFYCHEPNHVARNCTLRLAEDRNRERFHYHDPDYNNDGDDYRSNQQWDPDYNNDGDYNAATTSQNQNNGNDPRFDQPRSRWNPPEPFAKQQRTTVMPPARKDIDEIPVNAVYEKPTSVTEPEDDVYYNIATHSYELKPRACN